MKRICILQIVALMICFRVKAQEPMTGCPKVIFQSSQITDSVCDNSIKSVGFGFLSNKIIIKYHDRDKKIIPEDSVWGIREKNNYPYRLFNGNYYTLYQLSPVCKYSRGVGKYTDYYFSKTLDQPIYSYTQKNIKQYTDSETYKVIAKEAETNRHEITMDVCILRTKIIANNLLGGAFEMKYYPYSKLATGLYISIAGKNIRDTFSFSIKKPSLALTEIGWLNQFDFMQKKNFRIGANLITGLAVSELYDKAIKDRVKTTYGYTNNSKKMAENYFLLLSPGMDFSAKLFSNRHNPDFYITGKARYCWAIGNTTFGTSSMFSGFTFALGLSMIGYDKEQF